MNAVMKASEFKAKALRVMDEVARTGTEVVITKNGRPVARLLPYRAHEGSLFGMHRNQITLHDELIAPIGDTWNAEH